MNSLSEKEKLEIGQLKSIKQIFSKFESQFDLEGQGQGQKFLKSPKPLDDQYTAQLKGKIPRVEKLLHSQGISQNLSLKANSQVFRKVQDL